MVIRTIVMVSSFVVASFANLVRVFAVDYLVVLVLAITEAISINLTITMASFARIFVALVQLAAIAQG